MKVVEIFKSIEGEGKRTGLPCSFIRLFGCNLRCSYCDTPYGWDASYEGETEDLSVDEIVDRVDVLGLRRVTVTGGEPLIHIDINALLLELLDRGYEVNVETNGTIKPTIRNSSIFYTMDYKLDCSGMNDRMNWLALHSLEPGDVLKFVVGSKQDLEKVKQYLPLLIDQGDTSNPEVYISPVFGKIEPKDIVEFVLENNLECCHVQVQLHKIIWNPDERGV